MSPTVGACTKVSGRTSGPGRAGWARAKGQFLGNPHCSARCPGPDRGPRLGPGPSTAAPPPLGILCIFCIISWICLGIAQETSLRFCPGIHVKHFDKSINRTLPYIGGGSPSSGTSPHVFSSSAVCLYAGRMFFCREMVCSSYDFISM